MRNYLAVVILLHMLVQLMLLLSVNRLTGFPQRVPRCLLAAGIGGIHSGLCLLPGLFFLGGLLWRCVFLFLMGITAYGPNKNGIRRCMLFLLLSMALGGVVLGIGDGGVLTVIGGGVLFCIVSWSGLGIAAASKEYVEVELSNGAKTDTLLALRDTGNCLQDPVTGQQVLVADAQSAKTLLGLSRQQLRCPVETVAAGIVPGLRLIPYRAVGQSAGMLVAIRLERVRIGNWQGSAVVAFAPEGLGEDNTYRALTGGMA